MSMRIQASLDRESVVFGARKKSQEQLAGGFAGMNFVIDGASGPRVFLGGSLSALTGDSYTAQSKYSLPPRRSGALKVRSRICRDF